MSFSIGAFRPQGNESMKFSGSTLSGIPSGKEEVIFRG